MVEADAAITRAAELAPDDRLIAFLLAQSRYELGDPAAELFERAAALWPENPDVIRNRALALASEGDMAQAQHLLAARLADHPDWLDGHRVLTSLRWTSGQREGCEASFGDALARLPRHQGLWLGWFATVAQHRDWPRAAPILDAAAKALGETRAITVARAFLACESGDLAAAHRHIAACGSAEDGFLAITRIRLALRKGEPAQALAAALPLTSGPLAGQAWPYVHAGWRLLGDARADWLAGEPLLAGTAPAGLSGAELSELATLLRQLHTAQLPYAEQSVRAGTQTDRSVLLRREPILQRTRAAITEAINGFIGSLPPHDAAHPVLAPRRDRTGIAGSWSVRLGAGGHNVVHSHPLGWLSAVLYVAVPGADEMGPAPAGHLSIGAPPPELGLDLPPLCHIAPAVGQLTIFPSFMWHGTEPIVGGERLNIALDVVPA